MAIELKDYDKPFIIVLPDPFSEYGYLVASILFPVAWEDPDLKPEGDKIAPLEECGQIEYMGRTDEENFVLYALTTLDEDRIPQTNTYETREEALEAATNVIRNLGYTGEILEK